MDFELRVWIAVLSLLLTANLMIVFRRNAVTFFVAMWLFYPNKGTNLFGINGISIFSFVELLGATMLLVIALTSHRTPGARPIPTQGQRSARISEYMVLLFLVTMVAVQHFVFNWFLVNKQSMYIDAPFGYNFTNIVSEVSALIFLFACIRLVNRLEQIENILYLFIIASLLMVMEYFTVNLVPEIQSMVGAYSFDSKGSFHSVFLNDYNVVGIVGGIASLAGLHFYGREGKWRWALVFLLCCGLVFVSFKRSIILAFCLGAFVLIYVKFYMQWPVWRRIAAVLSFAGFVALVGANFDYLLATIAQMTTSEYMADRVFSYASSNSVMTRMGIQARALEVIADFFPMGVGVNMLRFYLPEGSPQFMNITDPLVLEGYNRVANGVVITESHNGYIEQVASYGLLGLLSLALLLFVFVRNLHRARRIITVRGNLYAFNIGLVIMIGVYYMFLGYPRVYIILFLALHLSFMLARQAEQTTWSGSVSSLLPKNVITKDNQSLNLDRRDKALE